VMKATHATRLIAAIDRDPDFAFQLAVMLRTYRVASPWEYDGSKQRRERRRPDGTALAFVKRHPTRKINPWEGLLAKMGAVTREEEHFTTETAAMEWADGKLETWGFRLAKGRRD